MGYFRNHIPAKPSGRPTHCRPAREACRRAARAKDLAMGDRLPEALRCKSGFRVEGLRFTSCLNSQVNILGSMEMATAALPELMAEAC